MFCEKCGKKLREGASFCNMCGARVSGSANELTEPKFTSAGASYNRPVNSTFEQPAQPQSIADQQQQRKYYAPGTHPYHKLGGFPLFVVVMNYIGGVSAFIDCVIIAVAYIFLINKSKWFPKGFTACFSFVMIGAIILILACGCVEIGFSNRIRRRNVGFLGYMQTASVTLMIICTVFAIASFVWLNSFSRYGISQVSSYAGQLISYGIGWLIGLILGSVYFSKSVRVRTYMGSDEYLRKSVFNKRSKSPVPADGSDQPIPDNTNIW